MDTFLYPLLASSYAAINDLHGVGLTMYTVIQQFHTADIHHTNGFAAQDNMDCFSTATKHGLDIHQVNTKKDPSKVVAACTSLCSLVPGNEQCSSPVLEEDRQLHRLCNVGMMH